MDSWSTSNKSTATIEMAFTFAQSGELTGSRRGVGITKASAACDGVGGRRSSILDHESICSGMDDLHIEDCELSDDFVGRSGSNQDEVRWMDNSMSSLASTPAAEKLKIDFSESLPLLESQADALETPAKNAISSAKSSFLELHTKAFTPVGFRPDHVPNSFYCPLTMEIMIDPVIDYEGQTYERQAIESWLKSHNTSPVTRKPLKPHHLAPNLALKSLIYEIMGEDWLKEVQEELKKSETAKKKRRHKGFIEHDCIYRNKIDDCLKDINGRTRLAVRLNARGLCAFSFKHLKFVIEVPEGLGSYFFITSFGKFPSCKPGGKISTDFMTLLLQNNNFPGSKGMSLDPETNEIIFSQKGQVDGESGESLQASLEAFIEFSLDLQKKVTKRFRTPRVRAPSPVSHEEPEAMHGDVVSTSLNCITNLPSILLRSLVGPAENEADASREWAYQRVSLEPRPRSYTRP